MVVTFPFLHALAPDYRYKSIHRQLDNFWQQLQVSHLDLLSEFETCEPADVVVSRVDAHPNELAHRRAAEAITGFLAEEDTR